MVRPVSSEGVNWGNQQQQATNKTSTSGADNATGGVATAANLTKGPTTVKSMITRTMSTVSEQSRELVSTLKSFAEDVVSRASSFLKNLSKSPNKDIPQAHMLQTKEPKQATSNANIQQEAVATEKTTTPSEKIAKLKEEIKNLEDQFTPLMKQSQDDFKSGNKEQANLNYKAASEKREEIQKKEIEIKQLETIDTRTNEQKIIDHIAKQQKIDQS